MTVKPTRRLKMWFVLLGLTGLVFFLSGLAWGILTFIRYRRATARLAD